MIGFHDFHLFSLALSLLHYFPFEKNQFSVIIALNNFELQFHRLSENFRNISVFSLIFIRRLKTFLNFLQPIFLFLFKKKTLSSTAVEGSDDYLFSPLPSAF